LRRALWLVLAAFLAVSAGCRPALPHATRSIEALAREVLAALASRDAPRLRELALSEAEFRDVIWPELPASRPERNMTVDYVWNDTKVKSEAGLRSVLAEHGGQSFEFIRVEFRGETTQHRSFLVRRDAVTVVRDDSGQEQGLKLSNATADSRSSATTSTEVGLKPDTTEKSG
jgi:hypothetical protein